MNLTQYVDNLRHELAVAAETGGDQARALADRLTAPLESAIRLTLLDALTAAADEITRDLAPGSVDVRLRGLEPNFVVTLPPIDSLPNEGFPHTPVGAPAPPPPPPPPLPPVPPSPEAEEGGVARINLRVPGHLKARIDDAAAQEGLSANAWLVRVIGAALDPGDRGGRPRRGPFGGQSYTGWVR
ncbi:toxin-antitoxin system HicB family antitoxin [Yinghuangia seranimata]|uniref:toxin-antitoxin system HicB family antitoxin n=1 Tax=Yinghuangia seranimata TaxID=408067 RepID=UPI00248ABB80|nr:toxin-antitoxin system HicB family antitoxin [Yinghuangia seranimata]MDI2127834.1 toxin-antitoxin system HicB family antitoxin [Yinghuangia seranimata]